jgi:hypothetical protein
MPTDLNRNEEEFLPEVEEALRRAGYDPGGGRDAEYALSFSVDAGPINADTALRLQRGRREVARSFARVGGLRMIFKRRKVIQESFDKALQSFERQLPQQGEALVRDDRGRSDFEEPRGNYARGTPGYSEDVEHATPYEDQD